MTDHPATVAPFGSWPSPLSAADLAASSTHLADLCTDGDRVLWLQSDPARDNAFAVMCWTAGENVRTLSPPDFNARTRVHEYGGGAMGAGDGVVLATSWDDHRVYRLDGEQAHPLTPAPVTPVPVTPEPGEAAGIRWAAMCVLPGGDAFVAVRETHGADRPRDNTNVHGAAEAVNELVRVSLLDGSQTVLVTGPDFVAGPWVSPEGTRMAWLQWNHPDMPWDTAELWVGRLDRDGISQAQRIAGGSSAVCDAYWDGEDRLLFSDDPSGWWNTYQWSEGSVGSEGSEGSEGSVIRLQQEDLDSGVPNWQHNSSRLTMLEGQIYVGTFDRGLSFIRRVDPDEGSSTGLDLGDLTMIMRLTSTDQALVALAGGPATPTAILLLDPDTAEVQTISNPKDNPAAQIGAMPQPITFGTPDGAQAHALYYPPTSATHQGPRGELPPVVVLSHGGPTGLAQSGLNATAQYWASRGLAVVDVNYRGSVGFGRAYRDSLRGNWGVHDVTDCIAASRHLADQGLVDGDRVIIEGGSAGGYTTLLALCTTDTFAAGGSSFGVADLRGLATDTHKFESRYLDSMIGPWPEQEQLYIDRSPISHIDSLHTPLIVLQGDEDAVVPPAQAELIVDALKDKGIAHAYLLFEGEQHGFRKTANIQRAVEARLTFYGRVLGFNPTDDVALPEFVRAT